MHHNGVRIIAHVSVVFQAWREGRELEAALCVPLSEEDDLRGMTLQQLETLTSSLQEKLRNRPS